MSSEDKPPTRDELEAMAYADGELAPDACRAFEERMSREPNLAREVVTQRRLALLARESAPPEPMDHEWARIARSPLQKLMTWLAWILILVGGTGLVAFGEVELLKSSADSSLKILVSMLVAGMVLLFSLTLQRRLRTKSLDPYTEVKR